MAANSPSWALPALVISPKVDAVALVTWLAPNRLRWPNRLNACPITSILMFSRNWTVFEIRRSKSLYLLDWIWLAGTPMRLSFRFRLPWLRDVPATYCAVPSASKLPLYALKGRDERTVQMPPSVILYGNRVDPLATRAFRRSILLGPKSWL